MKSLKSPVFFVSSVLSAGTSALFERGCGVMPEPQKVRLGESDFRFGADWRLELGPGVAAGDAAAEALREDLQSRYHLPVDTKGFPGGPRLTTPANTWPPRSHHHQ